MCQELSGQELRGRLRVSSASAAAALRACGLSPTWPTVKCSNCSLYACPQHLSYNAEDGIYVCGVCRKAAEPELESNQ